MRDQKPPEVQWADSFVNLLAGLGVPGRDKFMSQQYVFNRMTTADLTNAYRGDWIARKAVTVPAWDMTREWRDWQADQDQIRAIEGVEKTLLIQQKVQEAIVKARLYGGSAIIIGVDAGQPEEELDLDKVTKDSLKFLHVLSCNQISYGQIIYDIGSKYYGQPEYYQANNIPASKGFQQPKVDPLYSKSQVKLHPSRVVRLIGQDIADQQLSEFWGDSVLQAVNDAVQMCGLVTGSLATLISEMKIDVISIPELKSMLSTDAGTAKVIKRFMAANAAKSVINTVLIDGNEKWQRIQAQLSGAPEVLATYLQIAAGAVDIPAGRFLGLPHRGLNVTGEADFRNYYDRLTSEQTVTLTPALMPLDEVIIRSALGIRPPEIWYEWRSLWQLSDGDKADIAVKKANAYKVDVDAGQLPPVALANARANQLIEDGTYPGLEKALDDAAAEGDTIEEQNAPQPLPAGTLLMPGQRPAPLDPNAPPLPPAAPAGGGFPPRSGGGGAAPAFTSPKTGLPNAAAKDGVTEDFNPYHGEHGHFASGPGGGGAAPAARRRGENIGGAVGGAAGGKIGSIVGKKLAGSAGARIGATAGGIAGTAIGRAVGRKLRRTPAPHETAAGSPPAPHDPGAGEPRGATEHPPSSIASRIKDFVQSPAAMDAILAAAQHTLGEIDDAKHSIIAGAVLAGLHVFTGGIPALSGPVGEIAAHYAIEKLSHAIGASLPDSFNVLKYSVDALKELRGIHDADQADDAELDAALVRFSRALDAVAPDYQDGQTGDYNPYHGPDGKFASGPGGSVAQKRAAKATGKITGAGGVGAKTRAAIAAAQAASAAAGAAGGGGTAQGPSPGAGPQPTHRPEWQRALINIAGGGSGGGPYGAPVKIRGKEISPEVQRALVIGGIKAAKYAHRAIAQKLRANAEAKAEAAKEAVKTERQTKQQVAKAAERRAREARRAKREAAAQAAKAHARAERTARRVEREQVKMAERAARVAAREAKTAAKEVIRAAKASARAAKRARTGG